MSGLRAIRGAQEESALQAFVLGTSGIFSFSLAFCNDSFNEAILES